VDRGLLIVDRSQAANHSCPICVGPQDNQGNTQ